LIFFLLKKKNFSKKKETKKMVDEEKSQSTESEPAFLCVIFFTMVTALFEFFILALSTFKIASEDYLEGGGLLLMALIIPLFFWMKIVKERN
jgi:hypothetical protein